MARGYDFTRLEAKWQGIWEAQGAFSVTEDPARPKFYCLEMYPYPSGKIHMGHVRNYSIGDVVARYLSMRGFNVLHPMGWDAFGFPAENAAFEHGVHPAKWTADNIAYMKLQLRRMGFSYDWNREITCCDPAYYRWNQWFFLKMLDRGLAYRGRAPVNWCEACQSVLSNEQAEGGVCWRHTDTPVIQKDLEQWFLKITAYVEELLGDLEALPGWPERVRVMQRNWIGKSVGAEVDFPLAEGGNLRIFTTRPDTLFGATFMVLAPEHPLALSLSAGTSQESAVRDFAARTGRADKAVRTDTATQKEGVFAGAYAVNPMTRERIPIWVANFVLMEYGTGAIMAVPAHDQRDFDFARVYGLPVRMVIQPPGEAAGGAPEAAYEGEGTMVNSGAFSGMESEEGKLAICQFLEERGIGKRAVNYRIRDWLISRQRYWGTPIPVVYCDACGVVPVPERDLPVILPHDVAITMSGGSPLERVDHLSRLRAVRAARDRHHGHLRGFLLVLPALRQSRGADTPPGPPQGAVLAAGGPVYRGDRARRPAPPVCALLHQGLPRPRPDHDQRAVHQPPDAGDGVQGNLSLPRARLSPARRGGWAGAVCGVPAPGGDRADREDVQVEAERRGPR